MTAVVHVGLLLVFVATVCSCRVQVLDRVTLRSECELGQFDAGVAVVLRTTNASSVTNGRCFASVDLLSYLNGVLSRGRLLLGRNLRCNVERRSRLDLLLQFFAEIEHVSLLGSALLRAIVAFRSFSSGSAVELATLPAFLSRSAVVIFRFKHLRRHPSALILLKLHGIFTLKIDFHGQRMPLLPVGPIAKALLLQRLLARIEEGRPLDVVNRCAFIVESLLLQV